MGQDADVVRAVIFVRGSVQNVGFRWWTRAQALELGVVGHARNLSDGRVEVAAQGSRDDVQRLHQMLLPASRPEGRPGRVGGVTVQWQAPRADARGFVER